MQKQKKLYEYVLEHSPRYREICERRLVSLNAIIDGASLSNLNYWQENYAAFSFRYKELAGVVIEAWNLLNQDLAAQERIFLLEVCRVADRLRDSTVDKVLSELKELLIRAIKKLTPQERLQLQDDRPIIFFIRKMAHLIAPGHVNSLLAPRVAKEDTFGNDFDALSPGQFIIADDGVTFIQLQDFFKSAWEKIQNGERDVFQYADAKGTIKSISENEKAQIIQCVPSAEQFFQLTAECQTEQKGSILSLLENLREALSKGDSHHAGSEYVAGSEANGGIATFYETWVLLPEELQNELRSLRPSWGGDETDLLGYVLDHLFNPINPTRAEAHAGVHQDVMYCIEILGGKLQSIIESNAVYLRSLNASPHFFQLQELFKNIQSSLESPVINFIRAGQYATAKVLIDENPKCLQEKFPSLIMAEAMKYAPVDFVKELLNKGPGFGLLQPRYLRMAVESGRVSILDLFGTLPNFMLDSVLMSAVTKGQLYIVDYICQKTNNFNVTMDAPQSPLDGKNALEVAIHHGHSDVTQYFLLKGLFSSSLNQYPAQLNVPDTLSAEVKSWLTIIKEVGANFIPSVHQANNNNLVATSAFLKKIDKVVNFILDQFKRLPAWSPKRTHLTNKLRELSTCTTDTALDAKLAEIRDIVAKHRETSLKGFFKLNFWRNTKSHNEFNTTFREDLVHLPIKRNSL